MSIRRVVRVRLEKTSRKRAGFSVMVGGPQLHAGAKSQESHPSCKHQLAFSRRAAGRQVRRSTAIGYREVGRRCIRRSGNSPVAAEPPALGGLG